MKTFHKIIVALVLILSVTVSAQSTNKVTKTVKIYGNCGMCKKNIETAGGQKNVAKVQWDTETKMATLVFNPAKTNQEEILKRIAAAGYDSDSHKAPDAAYDSLHGCCQYDRVVKKQK